MRFYNLITESTQDDLDRILIMSNKLKELTK